MTVKGLSMTRPGWKADLTKTTSPKLLLRIGSAVPPLQCFKPVLGVGFPPSCPMLACLRDEFSLGLAGKHSRMLHDI